jgi:D-glycero-alpha-D-manno-heptose-7-phosphate kinase
LRISLFGGGTDFPGFYKEEGGLALSTAIDKYIFVTIKQRFDDKLRVGYTRTEMVDTVDQIDHELIREALRVTGITKGVEITTMGDIPAGSGLGSSGTVTVGALNAMYMYQGQSVTVETLAEQACDIEINRLKKPVGVQDQYIAAYGGLRLLEFPTTGKITSHKVYLSDTLKQTLNENLILFYTGMTRKSSSILSEQKENIKDRITVLRKIKNIAQQAYTELNIGNTDALGHLLHESWVLKKQLASKISNGVIDSWYQVACEAGALGGKITGAGGGGFFLLYCPYEKRAAVRKALKHLREIPIRLETDGSKVIFNYRR